MLVAVFNHISHLILLMFGKFIQKCKLVSHLCTGSSEIHFSYHVSLLNVPSKHSTCLTSHQYQAISTSSVYLRSQPLLFCHLGYALTLALPQQNLLATPGHRTQPRLQPTHTATASCTPEKTLQSTVSQKQFRLLATVCKRFLQTGSFVSCRL